MWEWNVVQSLLNGKDNNNVKWHVHYVEELHL